MYKRNSDLIKIYCSFFTVLRGQLSSVYGTVRFSFWMQCTFSLRDAQAMNMQCNTLRDASPVHGLNGRVIEENWLSSYVRVK